MKIFLDIDGVISDFDASALLACGIDPTDPKVRNAVKTDYYKRIDDYVGGSKRMWKSIDRLGEGFWSSMRPFPWAQNLWNVVNELSDGNACFLTAPSTNPCCCSGKVRWIANNFKNTRKFLIGPVKHMVASHDSLLIDDTDKKITSFAEAGGHTFKWPHPYMIEDGEVSYKDLIGELRILVQEIKDGRIVPIDCIVRQ